MHWPQNAQTRKLGGRMFLENSFVIPLFDVVNGGPPRAFECRECGEVCKTESGMFQHLKRKHDWEEQPCLSSMDSANQQPESGEPRKLRVFTVENMTRTKMNHFSIQNTGQEPEAKPEVPHTNEPRKPDDPSQKDTSPGNLFSQIAPENS